MSINLQRVQPPNQLQTPMQEGGSIQQVDWPKVQKCLDFLFIDAEIDSSAETLSLQEFIIQRFGLSSGELFSLRKDPKSPLTSETMSLKHKVEIKKLYTLCDAEILDKPLIDVFRECYSHNYELLEKIKELTAYMQSIEINEAEKKTLFDLLLSKDLFSKDLTFSEIFFILFLTQIGRDIEYSYLTPDVSEQVQMGNILDLVFRSKNSRVAIEKDLMGYINPQEIIHKYKTEILKSIRPDLVIFFLSNLELFSSSISEFSFRTCLKIAGFEIQTVKRLQVPLDERCKIIGHFDCGPLFEFDQRTFSADSAHASLVEEPIHQCIGRSMGFFCIDIIRNKLGQRNIFGTIVRLKNTLLQEKDIQRKFFEKIGKSKIRKVATSKIESLDHQLDAALEILATVENLITEYDKLRLPIDCMNRSNNELRVRVLVKRRLVEQIQERLNELSNLVCRIKSIDPSEECDKTAKEIVKSPKFKAKEQAVKTLFIDIQERILTDLQELENQAIIERQVIFHPLALLSQFEEMQCRIYFPQEPLGWRPSELEMDALIEASVEGNFSLDVLEKKKANLPLDELGIINFVHQAQEEGPEELAKDATLENEDTPKKETLTHLATLSIGEKAETVLEELTFLPEIMLRMRSCERLFRANLTTKVPDLETHPRIRKIRDLKNEMMAHLSFAVQNYHMVLSLLKNGGQKSMPLYMQMLMQDLHVTLESYLDIEYLIDHPNDELPPHDLMQLAQACGIKTTIEQKQMLRDLANANFSARFFRRTLRNTNGKKPTHLRLLEEANAGKGNTEEFQKDLKTFLHRMEEVFSLIFPGENLQPVFSYLNQQIGVVASDQQRDLNIDRRIERSLVLCQDFCSQNQGTSNIHHIEEAMHLLSLANIALREIESDDSPVLKFSRIRGALLIEKALEQVLSYVHGNQKHLPLTTHNFEEITKSLTLPDHVRRRMEQTPRNLGNLHHYFLQNGEDKGEISETYGKACFAQLQAMSVEPGFEMQRQLNYPDLTPIYEGLDRMLGAIEDILREEINKI